MEDDSSYATYGEAFEVHCARFGRDPDNAVLHCKEKLNAALAGQVSPEHILDLRLQAYSEIINSLVKENVFSQYMYKTLPACNHLWTFKRQFCAQLALSAFASTILKLGGRSPNKILFARDSGKVFQTDFHPQFDQHGLAETGEPVPFRLTRNLQTFFTPFGVEGCFVTSIAATAQAVLQPGMCFEAQLALFFRDQLMLWPWRRQQAVGPQVGGPGPGASAPELKQIALRNMEKAMERCHDIAPLLPSASAEGTPVGGSVQRGVSQLVEQALSPKNLCRMDATWWPWF